MIIPQIDIPKTRQAIVEMARTIPSRKMFEIILRSIDVMMDDIVGARNEIVTDKPEVHQALEKWDQSFQSFGEREALYYKNISEATDDAMLEIVAAKPLLKGEYPDGSGEVPEWADVETPWRLMNSLSLIAAAAGKKRAYFTNLEERWMDNFGRFWMTSAISLSRQARLESHALVQTIAFEGPGSGSPPESSLYDQAAAKAKGTMETVSDFFSGKTVEEAKKGAKQVGIGLGVGLFVGIAVATLVFWRLRR
jgi:hypothetical protein